MCKRFILSALIGTAFCILCSLPAIADVVTLKDGRWIEGKVEDLGDSIKIHLKNGTVEIPAGLIKNVLTETEGKLTSKQKKERAKIEQAIEDIQKHSMWRDKYTDETKHFVFHYNVTPDIAQVYIDTLENFYADFGKKLGVKLGPGAKRKKMEINICRDSENYVQIGGAPGTAGYWNFVEERLFFYHDRNDPEFTLSVLLHEFTHLLTHLIQPKFCHPIWCNEGIAEYFGASKREGSKLSFGHMQEGRLVLMNKWREDGNDYHLEELMRTPPGAFGSLEYGWGWTFLHFALENKKYKKKFMKYYVGLAKGSGIKREDGYYYYPTVKPSEDIEHFKKCFGIKSLDKLNKEWHDYIDENLSVVSGAGYLYEAKTQFYSDTEKAHEAITMAEEKWEGKPSPVLYFYKGRILQKMDESEEAEKAFKKAIELDPINGRYYYYLGDTMEEMDDEKVIDDAVRFKSLSLELSPDDYSLRHKVEQDERSRNKRKKAKNKKPEM